MGERQIVEMVYLVLDFYDVPLCGIAELRGIPNVFLSVFDPDNRDWRDYYVLSPISDDTFDLCLQVWAIERRFSSSRRLSGKLEWNDSGKLLGYTIPALPPEEERHERLLSLIENQLSVDLDAGTYANARWVYNSDLPFLEPNNPVKWTIIPKPEGRIVEDSLYFSKKWGNRPARPT